jgi:hypothetical protein
MSPFNPFLVPALTLGAFANLIVVAADAGKTGTIPANPFSHMVTVATTMTNTASVADTTYVANTVLNIVHDTLAGRPRSGVVIGSELVETRLV